LLRIVSVDRRVLAAPDPVLACGGPSAAAVAGILDRRGIPDGFPFVVDDDGGMRGCRFVNAYLLEALRQDAYALRGLRNNHLYHLVRLLRFVREGRAAGGEEPLLDLTDVTRQDLLEYRRGRQEAVRDTSWQAESGAVSVFFGYAKSAGWMDADPVPRWGARRRNTFRGRAVITRQVRFLTESQLRLFLDAGLRGDAPADPGWRPAYPERDYALGLVLAATALRREECGLLLDCEIPRPEDIAAGGVAEFTRYGKGGRPRTVYVAVELAREIDLFRRCERAMIVETAQRSLRRRRRDGVLLVADGVIPGPDGRPRLKIEGRLVKPELLGNADRARAVRVLPDGTIEPLALFTGRTGLPPGLQHWDTVFADARLRVAGTGHPDLPPPHLAVSPHVMRHTFAVRMLSGLMRLGRERAANPYLLLANPVLTVQQLLGHASPDTTQRYLFAAERYTDELPAALREHVATAAGHTASRG
jgi:integrase